MKYKNARLIATNDEKLMSVIKVRDFTKVKIVGELVVKKDKRYAVFESSNPILTELTMENVKEVIKKDGKITLTDENGFVTFSV